MIALALIVTAAAVLIRALVRWWVARLSPGKPPSLGLRASLLLVQCIALFACAEAAYRALLWDVARRDPLRSGFVLYGVGDSTLLGEPFDDALSLPGLVREMVGGRAGDREITVRTLAQRDEGSYAQSLRLEQELIGRDPSVPGAALIYTGNNEGYLGDGAGGGAPALAAGGEGWRSAISHSRLLVDLDLRLRSLPFLWPRPDLRRYERSLRRIVECARDSGLLPILITVPSNISGLEPSADAGETPGLPGILEKGAALEAAGDFDAALHYYREQHAALGARQPVSALLLLYRMAHCEQALGRFEEARRLYVAVVDGDSRRTFGRATTAQNNLVRRLSAEYGVPLVDAVKVFQTVSPHGILGDEMFGDGYHPTLHGYLLLARGCAVRLAAKMHATMAPGLDNDDQVAARFHISDTQRRLAHLSSGSWLLAVSVRHPWPVDRLALAEGHFRAAAGGDDDLSAWLGVAIAQAARKGFLREAAGIDLLGRAGIFTGRKLRLPSGRRDAALREFRSRGVEAPVLARLDELWR
jgi:tetratricopeptide (TPR) repeat protein